MDGIIVSGTNDWEGVTSYASATLAQEFRSLSIKFQLIPKSSDRIIATLFS